MANILATITAVDTPAKGWYKAKISTNATIEVSAVSLFAAKFTKGQQVHVIQYRDWNASPEFGFTAGDYRSLVYVTEQNKGSVMRQNPANTSLAYIANLVGNKKMLYHPARVTKVNASTLGVIDRVTGQALTLSVANVNAQDFKVGFGCLIEVASATIIGFWRSVPDTTLPSKPIPGTGKYAQIGYAIERNFIFIPNPFHVTFGGYVSYRTASGFYVWEQVSGDGYDVPSDPAGDGNYIFNPSITMMNPTSKYIYPDMTDTFKRHIYRRRFNRETQRFEDDGGLFVDSTQRQYSDCQYILRYNISGKWELCDWDGTNPTDVDSVVTSFFASLAPGTPHADYIRLFVMNNQPLLLSRVDYGGGSYSMNAVNVLSGGTYHSPHYSVGGAGAWCNGGHTKASDDRFYLYAGNHRIRIDPSSVGSIGDEADNNPVPYSVWMRPMSSSTGLTLPEGDEYEPWFDGKVLRNGSWLWVFPQTDGVSYQTGAKENHIYSAY